MKALHFVATAENQGLAGALIGQANAALGPFSRFVTQAIKTAQQRQTRYRLPWQRVRERTQIRLEPVDSVVLVPRADEQAVLVGWTGEFPGSDAVPGFVMDRSQPVALRAVAPCDGGLRVTSDPPLQDGDRVVWRSQQLVARVSAPAAPSSLCDERGTPMRLRGAPAAHGDSGWRVCVEGTWRGAEALVDGVRTPVEVASAFDDLRALHDGDHAVIPPEGASCRVDVLPRAEVLVGDNGVRFRWEGGGRTGRGVWIQLLLPREFDADSALDPRAAFCEGEIDEVWTSERRGDATSFSVRRVDAEGYRLLLDREPPAGTSLHLPVETRNLDRQRRAIKQLQHAPLPHHRALLRLCEDPTRVRWPELRVEALPADAWRFLRDVSRDGTGEQRRFVEVALATPDIALLEGPPGSGKTTAICELIAQLARRGQRVLLCASTHYAIDNVLERVFDAGELIDAVRIGRLEKVDERVRGTSLERRVEAMVEGWRELPAMRPLDEKALRCMAERTVLTGANLTCGTTMGILGHPAFQPQGHDAARGGPERRPLADRAHWDVLIVDEASKTLVQEFLVPAALCRRWIIVGDVRQLPPFCDREDLVANLRGLVDARETPVFSAAHQRACLLVHRLLDPHRAQPGARWLLTERRDVLDHVERELHARGQLGEVVRIVRTDERGSAPRVSLRALREGDPSALRLLTADLVLIDDGLVPEAEPWIPGDLLPTQPLHRVEAAGPLPRWRHRQAWAHANLPPLMRPVRDRAYRERPLDAVGSLGREEVAWLERHDLAGEVAWRLTRAHDLRGGRAGVRERLRGEIRELLPRDATVAKEVETRVAELEDIGLPSVLEVLQTGIGSERSERRSALTEGLRGDAFAQRFVRLRHQHRMHPEISRFPRDAFYLREALVDANTIASRDATLGWDFDAGPTRCVWAHVRGDEQGGVNRAEVDAVIDMVVRFVAWARRRGAPARTLPGVWEVACLSFYAKQEAAMAEALRRLTGSTGNTRFTVADAPVEVVCGTVDRFQGREADLVILSLRNTSRLGFLDSPNRLNVALTRARQQLVVVGNADYFGRCRVDEMEELVRRTPRLAPTRRGGAR